MVDLSESQHFVMNGNLDIADAAGYTAVTVLRIAVMWA